MPKVNNKIIKNIQSNINQLSLKQNNSKNILDNINTLMTKITNCKNYTEYNNLLENYVNSHPKSKFIEDNIIQHSEYILKTGLESNSNYYEQIYPALKRKGVTIIPDYVMSAKSKEGFSISIFKIDGFQGDNLLDFDENYNLLSENEKQIAYKNIKDLLNLGIFNPAILQDGLKIIPSKNPKITCIDWENLKPVESYTEEYGQNTLDKLTNQYYMKLFK